MSNTFIDRADYLPKIRDNRLTQMTNGNSVIIDGAEQTAIQVVSDSLHTLYDVDSIFSKTGTNRDTQVVRWVTNLVLYYLYERIPQNQIPEAVILNYDETTELLKDLELGKRSVQLPLRETADNKPETRFRHGGSAKRTH